jgi:hypothetical protein
MSVCRLAGNGFRFARAFALAAALCVSTGSFVPALAAQNPAVDDFLVDEFGKSRLWNLDVPRNEVEAVVAEFMNAYNAGDRDRVARLFDKKVITDHGEQQHAELVDEYGEHFLATVARYLNLRNARWQKTPNGVMTEVDFSLREQSKLDNKDRDYSGAVRFYLSNASGRWHIVELYFAYDPPPDRLPRKKE